MFFVNLGKYYLVRVGSSLGYDMIYEREDFFDKDVTYDDIQMYVKWCHKRITLSIAERKDALLILSLNIILR